MIYIVAYAVSVVCAYFLMRKIGRECGSWTHGDRALVMVFAITGPVGCIASVVVLAIIYRDKWDKPAKW